MTSSRTFMIALAMLVGASTRQAAAQTPVGTSLTFQGQLVVDGQPANGVYDFYFDLWDADSRGRRVSEGLPVEDVTVENGVFSLELDFEPDGGTLFDGNNRWVQVLVRPGESNDRYTTLTPRQKLTAAPYASYALAGPGVEGQWSLNGQNIHNTNAGFVGIGTDTPLNQLHIVGNQATLRLDDNDNPGSFTEIRDATIPQLRINKTNNAGQVLFDLNPKPEDGISDAQVRFFRETNTTGPKYVFFLRGNFTTQASARIAVDGEDSFFQAHGGNLGVGTVSPNARLHVVGDGAGTVARFTNGGSGGTAIIAGDVTGSGRAASFYGVTSNTLVSVVNDGSGKAMAVGGDVTISDRVGIGNPQSLYGQLTVIDGNDGAAFAISADWNNASLPTIFASNAGGGPVIWASGTDDASPSGGGVIVAGAEGGANIAIDQNEIMARNAGQVSTLYINNEGGDVRIGQNGGGSTVYVPVLAITGADLAEKFPVSEKPDQIEPGTVMEIDPEHPGKLRIARGVYNRRVAGVVSGAGDLPVGAVLGNLPGHEDAPAIALSGRVWVKCDASQRAIEAGDLLTTSATGGHAMAVRDHDRAQGAILGKAMTSLKQGETGLVLVLVSLQ